MGMHVKDNELQKLIKSIGRLIAVLVDAGIIDRKQAVLILDPLKAEPERKKGKWEIYVISMLDGEDCRCSECGKTGCAPYWNYCPNCGARMEEK